jgi:hypothetical protein
MTFVILTTFYRIGHEKVPRLPFCTSPCYCINFCIYAMLRTGATFGIRNSNYVIQNGPRKSSPGPQHSVNTEINTVATTPAKRKAGYFFVAYSVYSRFQASTAACLRSSLFWHVTQRNQLPP